MWKIVIGFGILCTALLILFQIAELRMIKSDANLQIVIAILAVVFFCLGLIFRKKLEVKPTAVSNDSTTHLSNIGISKRELDVLAELVTGASNKEIGDKLFLSESTIKSHLSSIYSKMEVRNRVEAINKAKDQGIQ